MRRQSLAVLALLAACSASSRYALDRPGLHCDRALRVTHRTMVALGYTVTAMVPPTTGPGVVAGEKTGPDGERQEASVRVTCDARGATLQPIEGSFLLPSFEFSRAFDYSFRELVQRPDVEVPARDVGLQLLVEAIDPFRAQLDLGGTITGGGAVPVRLTVRNNTDRAVLLDAAGVALTTADGREATPLAGAALDAALTGSAAARVRPDLLRRVTVAPHTTVVRWLVYPPGSYREAQIALADPDAPDEAEGFVAPVQ